ncbi:Putative anthrone oxygenase [Colletotrichum destructivum]|uniref:Anthrone oxygenase n=1 Tax=Colletotrichum destructivum TaxID=34406 RepID=A0AAX4J302_9PEZI|nr:Putative anthrone oxygenase [Colletotrichum destructivum]
MTDLANHYEDWTRALQLANLLAVAHLAGYQFASDKIALHNVLQLEDKDMVVKHWFRGWDFGRKYGPTMVCGTAGVFGFLAWKDGTASPAFLYNLTASVLSIFVAPYTQFRIFPLNDKLLREYKTCVGKKKTDGTSDGVSLEVVREWAAEWKRLDMHRQLLAYLAAISGLVAVLKT